MMSRLLNELAAKGTRFAATSNTPPNALGEGRFAASDFQREIHPGDTIEVLTERKTAKDGRVGGYGPVRYAALTLQGEKHEIFRFKNGFGEFAWFDAKGNSVKKSLLRTPVPVPYVPAAHATHWPRDVMPDPVS
jgi:hypothetical protein